MIDIIHSRCEFNDCTKCALFNYEDLKAKYCRTHKLEIMIDVTCKTSCIYEGCNIRPTFNYSGESNAIFCNKHKLEDMINVKDEKCMDADCNLRPSFNYDGCQNALYCSNHKLDGMINVKCIKCETIGCKNNALYNFEHMKIVGFCNKHKLDGMINVKNKLCIYENCDKYPIFNYSDKDIGIYCSSHKLEDMVDVKHNKCIIKDCNYRAYYNYEGIKSPIYCYSHKENDMINVSHSLCKTYLCNIQISDKYEGYCLYCFIHLFPEKPVSRNYKTKEKSVVDYILKEFKDYTWITDKKIEDGCSKRRPDILLDLGYQIIIIEIDENQHIDYDSTCENKRMMEISKDLGHRPVVLIRFNPDDYISKENKKINSCWAINGKGFCTIKKSYINEWDIRLNKLKDTISYWISEKNISSKTLEIVYLYFDEKNL